MMINIQSINQPKHYLLSIFFKMKTSLVLQELNSIYLLSLLEV